MYMYILPPHTFLFLFWKISKSISYITWKSFLIPCNSKNSDCRSTEPSLYAWSFYQSYVFQRGNVIENKHILICIYTSWKNNVDPFTWDVDPNSSCPSAKDSHPAYRSLLWLWGCYQSYVFQRKNTTEQTHRLICSPTG